MANRSLALRSKQRPIREDMAYPMVGRIVGIADSTRVLVEFDENEGATLARVAAALSAEQLEAAASLRQSAVLVFERGRADRPILLALLVDAERVPEPVSPSALRKPEKSPLATPAVAQLKATVDGKRIQIIGEEEIVLRCGQASITLRRNGRVVVRGTHLETDSDGVNRIKGATVKIN